MLPPIVGGYIDKFFLDNAMMLNSKLTSFLVLLVCMLTVNIASAEVYRWYDEYGRVHFSDKASKTTTNSSKLPIRTYNESRDYGESTWGLDEKLIMYATSWCGYCKKARKYLKGKRIPYTEYDIENDSRAKAEYDQLGAPGVPLFLMGKKQMSGFNEQSFEAFYR